MWESKETSRFAAAQTHHSTTEDTEGTEETKEKDQFFSVISVTSMVSGYCTTAGPSLRSE